MVWSLTGRFKHLDLEELVSKCDPARPLSARGRRYTSTSTGQVDNAIVFTALSLKNTWATQPSKAVRMKEIDLGSFQGSLAPALKRLEKMKQVKIDFDIEGVLVTPGPAWIENSKSS